MDYIVSIKNKKDKGYKILCRIKGTDIFEISDDSKIIETFRQFYTNDGEIYFQQIRSKKLLSDSEKRFLQGIIRHWIKHIPERSEEYDENGQNYYRKWENQVSDMYHIFFEALGAFKTLQLLEAIAEECNQYP